MSFVDANGIMTLTEELVASTLTKCTPQLKHPPTPFPTMSYSEAMEKVANVLANLVYSIPFPLLAWELVLGLTKHTRDY